MSVTTPLADCSCSFKTQLEDAQRQNVTLLAEVHALREEMSQREMNLTKQNAFLLEEIKAVRRKMSDKEKQNSKLFKQKMEELLSRYFTPGQVRRILNPKLSRVHWCKEDIAAAISLRSVSPKAYRYLRKGNKIPLPAMSTLRKWVADFNMNEGILDDVLDIMKYKGESMSSMEKLAVICFDEIHLSPQVAIERREERVVGPHSRCQVVVARGLFKKWKQPVFYNYDQELTEQILFDIIRKLHDIGYTVIAMTSDLGPSNKGLLGKLGIYPFKKDSSRTSFQHPCDATMFIHVFLDIPHLIKLLRNHFLDSGIYVNGKLINAAALQRLLELNSGDLKIVHKLTPLHLDVTGTQRQNVKLATQVFSSTNAAAIKRYGMQKLMDECPNWSETADFLKLFNDWFDIFNSVCKFGTHPGLNAFGVNLTQQNAILSDVTSIVQNMRVAGKKSLLPFQNGILLSNASLRNLYEDLRIRCNSSDKESMSYILTNRLNQDVLENLFSYLRAMGAAHDKPSALDIRYRLRWYILGKHSIDVFTVGSNTTVQDSDNETCLTAGIDIVKAKEAAIDDDNAEYTIANVTDCNIENDNSLSTATNDNGKIP